MTSSSANLPIELIETSFEKIKPRAEEFAASFYKNLFITYPETQPLFTKYDLRGAYLKGAIMPNGSKHP